MIYNVNSLILLIQSEIIKIELSSFIQTVVIVGSVALSYGSMSQKIKSLQREFDRCRDEKYCLFKKE